jgi:hypothetical protein
MSKQTKQAPAKQTKAAKQTSTSNEFISEDMLSSGSAKYLKLEKGTQFRIISNPVSGWLEWLEEGGKKKPVRTPLSDGEPEASDEENPPKKFVTFVVFDRKDSLVKILELTQQSVIKAIRALTNNPEWGNPFTYDINVTKTGEKMLTKYTVTPSPKKPLSKADIAVINEDESRCNLEALFANEDPWKIGDDSEVTEYHLK